MHFSTLFRHCPACGSSKFTVHNVKSKCCELCGFVYYMNASAAVAAFILNDKRELLVCKRAKEPEKGTLDLPGGFVDENETAEMAIAREINEELNAEINESNYLFSLPNEYIYSSLTIPTLDLFFSCTLHSFESIRPADDVAEIEFIPLHKLNPDFFGLKSIKKAVKIFQKNNL